MAETKTLKGKTSIQLEVDTGTGRLEHRTLMGIRGFNTYREMRIDPTISLGRAMVAAPVLAASWTVESDDEKQQEFMNDVMLPLRPQLMSTATYGMIDFGWKGYEVIFGQEDMNTIVDKIAPLKNDDTWVLYDIKANRLGLENQDRYTGAEHFVDKEHSLFINFDAEGLGEYGIPLLRNAYQPWMEWKDANEAAARYDNKLAGEHWIVYYPVGRTQADFLNSADSDGMASNDVIAGEILKQLKASGSVSVPVFVDQMLQNMGGAEVGWRIELLSSAGLQASFVDRLSYLDSLKIRALLMPERAVLEGQFGTKAEAETHADMALVIRQLQHEGITQMINEQLVDSLSILNFGDLSANTKLVAMPLSDENQALYKELFLKLMDNPESSSQVVDGIDFDELREALSIPVDPNALNAMDGFLEGDLGQMVEEEVLGIPPAQEEGGSLLQMLEEVILK